jgi:hypothetical protein
MGGPLFRGGFLMTADAREPSAIQTARPEELEERWFAAEKPTWRPPRLSSRPPSAPPPAIGDDDADTWFV